ncbi:hypothetical protein A2V49_04450 [candidate division WWE3 bacterium RBG_19FT_COMBO_34_6]|uniref:ABC transporter substrate-binding protein n=1 Tax=candidate division WWE3 bacterium RBG_19FT_COMBO_34_6 TaxID=1802612 RepID=A0A1F4UN44_UNCKA|nr:MAG: hypothetical protein A2V49_04450 [candidate division WWE3 bacterium RBG_19FT_COMBO_34_6]
MIKLNCSKNKIATFLLVLVIPFFLTACSLSDLPVIGKYLPSSTGKGTSNKSGDLTVWGLWENQEVMKVLIAKFNETHPNVTVTYEDRSILKPQVDYKEKVFRRASDETAPDVMRVHIGWITSLKDLLVPMPSSMMSVETLKNSFYKVASDNLIIDNQIYGLPTYYDGLVLVYNKDHFKEVGQVEPPTAWEEFRRLALELTIRGEDDKIIRGGAAVGNADNIDFYGDIIGMLFSQAGVVLIDGLDSVPAQDAVSFYTNFILEDKVWSGELPEASAAFSQGKVSMIFVPSWNLLDILASNPQMNIGVAAVPQAAPDTPATWGSFWVDVVPKSSKNPDLAWEYIKFMADEPQQLMAFSEASKYRAYGAPYSLVSLSPQVSSSPYLKPLLDSAQYAKTGSIASRAGNKRQEDALKEAINSIVNHQLGVTIQSALEKAKQDLLK